ncbi:Uncharacterised protein [Enterococcus faecalis]|nr:Uncharacterised protein [Enterococcus faecalis]
MMAAMMANPSSQEEQAKLTEQYYQRVSTRIDSENS